MNVLMIAQVFPPDMGGGPTRAYNVARGLLHAGCKVSVISAFPHYPYGKIPQKYRWKPLTIEYWNGLKLIRTFVPPLASKGTLNRIFLFASFTVSAIWALPLIGKVDVIWAANPDIIAVFPAILFRLVKRCPIIQNVDNLWPEDLSNFNLAKKGSFIYRIGSSLAKIAYRQSDAITPISPGYAKAISKNYNVTHDKLFVIRAGVDLEIFSAHVHKNKDNYSRSKKFKIMYIGAFSVAYDFDQILMAAKELEYLEDIEFIIQGGGELSGYIREKIKEFELKNVNLIDKIVSRKEVARLSCDADALILPLRDFERPYLGISSKLYEYQAAGKPIVCCSNDQPGRYVSETKSGIVVEPGDFEGLAKAILHLCCNREVAECLGEAGRYFVEENLSLKKIGSRMMRVFKQVLANPSEIRKEEQNMVWDSKKLVALRKRSNEPER